MKRKLLLLVTVLAMMLTACGEQATTPETSVAETTAEATKEDTNTNSDSAFQVIQVTEKATEVMETEVPVEEVSFEEANIVTFEMKERDDESYSEIIAYFTATNNGSDPIDYISVDYIYKDGDGNIICDDGRYHNCQMPVGSSALLKSYSHLDDHEKSDIVSIEVTGYRYYVGEKQYKIDLDNQLVSENEHSVSADADFDAVNILSFEYTDKGLSTFGSYEVGVKAKNTGFSNIIRVSFDMAYFDADGNYLQKDGRYNDNTLAPDKFVEMKSFCMDDNVSEQVKAYGIYAYDYRLAEDDANGFNYYEINLQTKEVKGRHRD